MLRNYLKIAWRNLLKHRLFTWLNLTGLSAGLAGTILIFLWVSGEWATDRFHDQQSQLFQVMEHRQHSEGLRTTPETAALLAEALKANVPGISLAAVSTPPSWFSKVLVSSGDKVLKTPGIFASCDYFRLFSYPFLEGSAASALNGANGVVISRELAVSLYQSPEAAMGKTLEWQIDDTKRESVISGVFGQPAAPASSHFDVVFAFDAFKAIMQITGTLNSSNSNGPFLTYVRTAPGVSIPALNKDISRLLQGNSQGTARNMFLRPFADGYLFDQYENGVQSGGRITYPRLFTGIAIFILLIACINFMNLSTARSATRMKEMGIRKSMGAGRRTLALQFLGESVMMSFLALCIALLIVFLLLPSFNTLTGKQLSFPADTRVLLMLPAIALLTGMLAGSYPALYMSGFDPVAVLKGKLPGMAGGQWARRALVVFQFSLSVLFIVGVLVMHRQLSYVQHRYPGFNREQVIHFEAEGGIAAHKEAFLAELRRTPGVVNAGGVVGHVLGGAASIGVTDAQKNTVMFRSVQVSNGLLETLGMQMKEGRSFSAAFPTDTGRIILNEAAVKALGLSAPSGTKIMFGARTVEVAGVVKDFHFQSLHETIQPVVIRLEPLYNTIMVRLAPGNNKATLSHITALFRRWNPQLPFEYSFLDADYEAQYLAENRAAQLSGYFTVLAVLISCLGLFGLTAFTAERRGKEMGIRKVLGAKAWQLMLLLVRDALRPVGVAVLLALPIAWILMKRWLEGFAYRIDMQPGLLLLAGACMLGVTLVTIAWQTITAALANPVRQLKE